MSITQEINMLGVTWIDVLAVLYFLICWFSYAHFASVKTQSNPSLYSVLHDYRLEWSRRLIEREVRIMDSNLIGTLHRNASLLVSTTIFILAGLIAVLGATDRAMLIAASLPFTVTTTAGLWELKVLLLIIVFVHAFFKFSWAMWQFSIATVLMGGAPNTTDSESLKQDFIKRHTLLLSLAGTNFNHGLRAYYFGIAALTWIVHPLLFILASSWVVSVLYKREFRSQSLRILLE
ncbi:DUF599 domain-containing protein [Beggiatoa leptomitoformis]|uniref:DUF599 family protein n=1 Tax=Beggiatoa leptomitoformis TaxID=288004 RepID=A0A2N9YDE4_9GAMM|nr:DUF599 family protein [Beggiatoa leptomitoformis]ALG69079.2 DUF599 family protein [Beggiatoa leptomitoformis]AUI68510.2 DUF599 family protein [Beggiatoa leptomitoformis]